jgi:hypothetical protein
LTLLLGNQVAVWDFAASGSRRGGATYGYGGE